MSVNAVLRAGGATQEDIWVDDNGVRWFVNYHGDGFRLQQVEGDAYLPHAVCEVIDLPGLRFDQTRADYWKGRGLPEPPRPPGT